MSPAQHQHRLLRAALPPFPLTAISCVTSPGSCGNQFPLSLPGWASGYSTSRCAVPSQRGRKPVVSRPRVETWGVGANHSAFYFTNRLFCVGCSRFQLELLSLWLFLKILVSNRLVPEMSHRNWCGVKLEGGPCRESGRFLVGVAGSSCCGSEWIPARPQPAGSTPAPRGLVAAEYETARQLESVLLLKSLR